MVVVAAAGEDPDPVFLTRAHCGETTTLRKGQEVVLLLAETPGTGYRWTCTVDGLAIEGDSYVEAPKGAIGGDGERRLRLTGRRVGAALVTATLHRSWEDPARAVDRCEFRFTIS